MEKLRQFSVVNFLGAALENQRNVMVTMTSGQVHFGTVQFTDVQGPHASFQIFRGEEDSPVICLLSQLVTIGWEHSEKRWAVIAEDNAVKKSLH